LVARATVFEGYEIVAGFISVIVTTTLVVADPAEFVAVTVYVVCAIIAVGVPEIAPEVVFSVNPFDRAGLTEYEVTVPVTAGVTGVMACPMLNVCGDA